MSIRIPDFRLYAITDRRILCEFAGSDEIYELNIPGARALLLTIETMCRMGVKCIQLREKDLSALELYQLGLAVREITNRYEVLFLVNDRTDIALGCGADGVHCREESMSPASIRKLDEHLLIGSSVHSAESAEKAVDDGADFLVFAPVFHPGSKTIERPPAGIDTLKQICDISSVPVYALGGITPSNTGHCLKAGARGVAGISAVMQSGPALIETLFGFKRVLGRF